MIKDFKYCVEWAWDTLFGVIHLKKYCPLWDAKLNELLDKYENDAKVGAHIIRLGEIEVWIANRFSQYGTAYSVPNIPPKRPSLKTMIRLAKLQDKHEEINYKKGLERIV